MIRAEIRPIGPAGGVPLYRLSCTAASTVTLFGVPFCRPPVFLPFIDFRLLLTAPGVRRWQHVLVGTLHLQGPERVAPGSSTPVASRLWHVASLKLVPLIPPVWSLA
jgi:hypothetical protein